MRTQVWVCTGVLPLAAEMQQVGYVRLAPFIVYPSLLKQPASRFQTLEYSAPMPFQMYWLSILQPGTAWRQGK